MRVMLVPALGAAMMLVACNQAAEEAPYDEPAMEEAAPAESAAGEMSAPSEGDAARARLTVGDGTQPADLDIGRPPQIAYVYDYGFRLAADAIAPLQQRHADLCEAKGPDLCRIIALEHSGPEGDYVKGTLQLAVASKVARGFGMELADTVKQAEGEQISNSITGEDLAKQIVDTEAHLRARTLLRDRLMEVLRTRKGSVQELVKAERSVAEVNEEIDQATSWLAEMRGKVVFSRMNLSYESGSPSAGGFMDPIRDALGNIGAILGWFFGMLITLLTVGVPLFLIALAVRLGWKRAGLAAPSAGEVPQ